MRRMSTNAERKAPGQGMRRVLARHNYQQAEAVARTITNPDSQAMALAQIARAMSRAGEDGLAARAAAAVCAIGKWTTALVPVLMVAPSAFEALEETLGVRHQNASSLPPSTAATTIELRTPR
jgi:hypothetical protein